MQAASAVGDALNSHIWLPLPFPMGTGHLLGLQVCVVSAENMSWIPKYLKRHYSPICRQLNPVSNLYIPYGCPDKIYRRLFNRLQLPTKGYGWIYPNGYYWHSSILYKKYPLIQEGLASCTKRWSICWGSERQGFKFLVWIRQTRFEPGSSTSSGSAVIIRPSANQRLWVNSCQTLIIWK